MPARANLSVATRRKFQCTEPTDIALHTRARKVFADSVNGKGLGRVNDLVADRKGNVYLTSGGLFHLSASGKVTPVCENLRTNGRKASFLRVKLR